MKKKVFLGIFVFGIILFASVIKTSSTTTLLSSDNQRNLALSSTSPKLSDLSLTSHAPIEILNDDNFTDYSFLGLGTAEEPYIIENYNITATYPDNKGIYINGTTKHFVIRNCYVDTDLSGIHISNVAEGTASIINSTCSNNLWGIYLSSSSGATLTNNTCSNNRYGIRLDSSSGAALTSNNFYNAGLTISEESVEDCLTYTVENNWVNDRLLGFYINLNEDIISDPIFGQLIFINCSEIVVCNQELTNTSIGLYLGWCENATIFNNVCSNNYASGIQLDSSSGATLTNNTCNNNLDGIRLSSSSGATLTNNTCSNNWHGRLYASSGIALIYSSGATLMDNTCSNNYYGIILWISSDAILTGNTCSNNDHFGVGVYLDSDNNIIHHNAFIDNNLNLILSGYSQACDGGANNTWYDSTTKEGNYWSEWNKRKPYLIYGDANATDPYPLNKDLERIDYEYTLVIPTLILLTILLKIKRKKKSKINY